MQRINWFLTPVIFLTWHVIHKLRQRCCVFRFKDLVQYVHPRKRKWSICLVPPLGQWLTTGSCQARRLDSDRAGFHRGAKAVNNSLKVTETYHNPSLSPTPWNNVNNMDAHTQFWGKFQGFQLPHPRGPDPDPISISSELWSLSQSTCSLQGALSTCTMGL